VTAQVAMHSKPSPDLQQQLAKLLDLRNELTLKRNDLEPGPAEQTLSDQIQKINEHQLPNLRKRILAAFNSVKGEEKHHLSKLLKKIDDAFNGMGFFHDIDISEERLRSLQKQQAVTKSHREARKLAGEIREIHRAKALLAKQQRSLEREELERQNRDAEIQWLDEVLYGHLPKGPSHDIDA
jgi:hypothetical protein